MTEFYVKVYPDSEDFKVVDGVIPEVYLTSEPENGKANEELKRKLSKALSAEVGIIAGTQSRRKKLKTDISEEELREKLSSLP